ncbi:MAG: hypothetical protein JSR72_02025 [Proteobacteria bacterium]|nr:hypothetical protein [Pseudomonadota bacterium]
MRALLTIAALAAVGIAGLGNAAASEWRGHYVAYYPSNAARVVVYDAGPGTDIRPYWARPWRGRHYYPFTGKKPKVGRLENLNARYPAPKPAPSYYREWSTLSLYPPQVVLPPAEIAPDDIARPYAPLMPPK